MARSMTYYTLSTDDVSKATIRAFGRVWRVDGFIGRVLPQDVGKRVYLRGGILQVENDEQRAMRMAVYAKKPCPVSPESKEPCPVCKPVKR